MMAYSVFQIGREVCSEFIISTGTLLEHHSKIADGVHLSPGTYLGDEVTIESDSLIINSLSIIQTVRISSSVTIRHGSVALKNLDFNLTAFENLAEAKSLSK